MTMNKGKDMSPRIRSFLRRPPYARERKSPREAPSVFREFVETLQRLDPPQRRQPAISKRNGYGRRPRKQFGNGHARPQRPRRRP
jgi:uncharacterized Fe-S cluster-containing radical SAM superfamily enzyme